LPFLRFTRDKRGYETTSLVHAVRRHGRSRQRILYWFRTPPDVKVGRPALDEDAIRWIEEHNPDIEFNWPKILEAKPVPTPPVEGLRNRRVRRDRPQQPPQVRPEPSKPPELEEPEELSASLELPELPEPLEPLEPLEGLEPLEQLDLAEAIEQLTHPDAEEKIEAPGIPVEHAVDREQLIRLRARFAELQTRITERGGDAERIAALRVAAEPLNPDTWVTEEEVRKGLVEFEPKIRELRAALGLRRRRRSRRGGRGRRTEGQ
jgi:hypothetical protein